MNILGLNAFHADSAACLIQDGKLIAAAEEERFTRVKHWAGFPTNAIRYCLEEAGLALSDVDHIATNQDSRAHFVRKIFYTLRNSPNPKLILARLKNRKARSDLGTHLELNFPDQPFAGEIHPVEHHLAHLSSAFHLSPFEEATVVSVDGFGDFASTAWGTGRDTELSVHGRVFFPHSLGQFYLAITQYLGFPHYGDEYKVMGLAPYGNEACVKQIRELILLQSDGSFKLNLPYFRHHTDAATYTWEDGIPVFGDVFTPALEDLLGPRRASDEPIDQKHMDIAHSAQLVYQEAFFHLLNHRHGQHPIDALSLAGGCANNSVANGRITSETPFKNVYIHAAPGDAGGAVGAAFALHHQLGGAERHKIDHAYWGPSFSTQMIQHALVSYEEQLKSQNITIQEEPDEATLCDVTADALAEGLVVGWFQGRMEWGPRALGNRSILGDPRRNDMKDILNHKIKRRESFRPFAPSVLSSHVGEWFEEDAQVPFMSQVFQIRKDKRAQIPAVTHVDGSGRLQTVSSETNGRYARLIEAFHNRTGVPMVLNTSFNENEPVVCRPEEAIDCFLRTKMDLLVLGDIMLRRSPAPGATSEVSP